MKQGPKTGFNAISLSVKFANFLFNQVDIIFSRTFPSHEVTWLEVATCPLLRFEISWLINHLALV